MIKLQKNSKGVTLIEILMAIILFAISVIPIYYGLSYGAAEEVNLTKISIARKILESFQDEIKDLDYEFVEKLVAAAGKWRPLNVNDLPPNSFASLLESQKKYKDFKFSGLVKKSADSALIKSLEFKVEITWTDGRGKVAKEKLAFIKVKR